MVPSVTVILALFVVVVCANFTDGVASPELATRSNTPSSSLDTRVPDTTFNFVPVAVMLLDASTEKEFVDVTTGPDAPSVYCVPVAASVTSTAIPVIDTPGVTLLVAANLALASAVAAVNVAATPS